MMNYAAVILAGGKSSRMGKDKAELLWAGKPLYQHQYDTAKAAGCNPIVISRNKNGFMQDKASAQGPLAGILSALYEDDVYAQGHLCVMPVDMPHIHAEMLEILIGAHEPNAITLFQDQVFPFIIPCALRPALEKYLTMRQSVQGFIHQQNITQVKSIFPDHMFANLNTPLDVKNALTK